LILEEIIHLLGQVKYNSNTHDKHNRKEECAQEFANNIFVESFQRVLKVLKVLRVLGVLGVSEFQAALPLVSCAVGTCFSVSSLKQRSGETARRA
jgi:uncharacterized membrane protein